MDFYSQSFSHLQVQKNQHHLWVTLNNPEQMNAITELMIDSLCRVLRFADADPEVRVIVLTGAGKNFCSGGDVKAMAEKTGMFQGEGNELRERYQRGIQQIPKTIEDISTPLIAMVNGAAMGAGCDLAMMCDLRIGTATTKFGETFTKLGLIPGDGGSFFLQRVVGYAKAMEMTLTGDVYEGERAYNFGLLTALTTEDQLVTEATRWAEKMAANAPIAQSMAKKALKAGYLYDLSVSLDLLAAFQGLTQRTEDHFAALDAIKAKAKPQFKNK